MPGTVQPRAKMPLETDPHAGRSRAVPYNGSPKCLVAET